MPESKESEYPEQVQNISISEIHPFLNHPFSVTDDELMYQTVDSIKQFGIINPAIIRPDPSGGYEMVSGHRKLRAAALAGMKIIPVIVLKLTDDEAIILLVDSNLQRENILPSERAKAYKMKMDAIRRQGQRHDLTSSQVETKLCRSDEVIANQAGESRAQVQRYIRLTELKPELQQMVDDGKIGLTPAVELSYLKKDEQELLLDTIESEQTTPSLSQAQRIKRLSQEGRLSNNTLIGIMMEQKKPESLNLTLSFTKIQKYFPRSYTPQRMEDTILKLLENWMKKRLRDQER